MKSTLALQPYSNSESFLSCLIEVASDLEIDDLLLVSAWVKLSGVSRVETILSRFRERGGSVRILAGLSQGGATEQGLEAALTVADSVHVVFDGGGRTFHPKFFVGRGDTKQIVFIGSQNLTAGGLSTNFEVGVLLTGDATDSLQATVTELDRYVASIVGDDQICRPLTTELIAQLVESDQVEIGNEFRRSRGQQASSPSAPKLFGSAQGAKNSTAAPSTRIFSKVTVPFPPLTVQSGPLSEGEPAWSDDRLLLESWSKTLRASDAQRLPTGHPSGHVALTQAGQNIDQSTYFRYEFFADCNWTQILDAKGSRERALVPFDISGVLGETALAVLEIDHYPSWESTQGNRASTLRWGPSLNSFVRHELNLVDRTLILEKFEGPYFRLRVE
jgi:HKD family nuclease